MKPIFLVSRQRTRGGRTQQGSMLIEAMIAIAIFSVGVLGLIKLQAEAIRQTTEAKMRSDASYLADKVMGDLAGLDLAGGSITASTIVTDFNCQVTVAAENCAGATAITDRWRELIARTLPGATLTIAINSIVDPLSASSSIREAAITVTWLNLGNNAAAAQRTFSQAARLVD